MLNIWMGVVLMILTSFASAQIAFAQTLTPLKNLEVVDATSRKVGDVIDLIQGQFPLVAYQLNGQVFAIVVAENSLGGNGPLLFQSANCLGTPFLPDNSIQPTGIVIPLLPSVAIAPPGNTLYLPTLNLRSQSITARSVQFAVGSCQVLPEPATGLAFRAQAMMNLDTLFTPPFRVQETPSTTNQ